MSTIMLAKYLGKINRQRKKPILKRSDLFNSSKAEISLN